MFFHIKRSKIRFLREEKTSKNSRNSAYSVGPTHDNFYSYASFITCLVLDYKAFRELFKNKTYIQMCKGTCHEAISALLTLC